MTRSRPLLCWCAVTPLELGFPELRMRRNGFVQGRVGGCITRSHSARSDRGLRPCALGRVSGPEAGMARLTGVGYGLVSLAWVALIVLGARTAV